MIGSYPQIAKIKSCGWAKLKVLRLSKFETIDEIIKIYLRIPQMGSFGAINRNILRKVDLRVLRPGNDRSIRMYLVVPRLNKV